MSNNNNSKTRAFETVDRTPSTSRRRLVIAIFVVVMLILAAFATLVIGKIVTQINPNPNPDDGDSFTYVPKDAGDYKIGSLLFVNGEFSYMMTDFSGMVNVKAFQLNSANTNKTEINGYYTYSLSVDRIALTAETLDALNAMMLDYCRTLDLSSANPNSASNLTVAWGGYTQSTIDEYETDISDIGEDFYDHILGTTITLKRHSPAEAITESLLKNEFSWIYENAHKYGFVLRYPNDCKDHTGHDGDGRVHLRYVGVAHATYIHEKGICLEEYLTALRTQYSSSSPLSFNAGGKSYQVYYVKYSGNPTNVPVPKDSNYTISGDNMNGFVVTVEK